jgi:outer membrane protein OmpA-like peptidoglycan-associated protein
MSTRFRKDAAMFRRTVIAGLAALMLMPAGAQAQQMPSSQQIERQLDASPRQRVRPQDRVTIDQLRRRPDLRRQAPSIDIQSINFAFGSAEIPRSQMDKVETIARALRQLSRRGGRDATILIEGHTDAVGSFASNQRLSEARAASLRRVLVREFGVSARMLETVGYGEEFLLVNTQQEDWRNRRVTLRRVDDFLRP